MPEQTLTLGGKRRAIFIETPLGLIEIQRLDGRQLRIITPEGMTAHRSEERALNAAKFVTKDSAGGIHPKYAMLVPVTNEAGDLVRVEEPPVYRAPRLAMA